MANAIRSMPAIHWKCEQNIVAKFMYPILSMTFLMRVQSFKIECSLVFHNLYIIHAMKYVSLNYLPYSRLMAVRSPWKNHAWKPVSGVWRQARRYLAFQMGTIQRLLCITFMTSQSQLWRYCCIVMSRGPWLLRRCFKRGFGDHRKQLIYEFNWTLISIEIQLTKTANRMAKIITLSVCKKI